MRTKAALFILENLFDDDIVWKEVQEVLADVPTETAPVQVEPKAQDEPVAQEKESKKKESTGRPKKKESHKEHGSQSESKNDRKEKQQVNITDENKIMNNLTSKDERSLDEITSKKEESSTDSQQIEVNEEESTQSVKSIENDTLNKKKTKKKKDGKVVKESPDLLSKCSSSENTEGDSEELCTAPVDETASGSVEPIPDRTEGDPGVSGA